MIVRAILEGRTVLYEALKVSHDSREANGKTQWYAYIHPAGDLPAQTHTRGIIEVLGADGKLLQRWELG